MRGAGPLGRNDAGPGVGASHCTGANRRIGAAGSATANRAAGAGPQSTWPMRFHARMQPCRPRPKRDRAAAPAQQSPDAAKPISVMAPNVMRVPNDANAYAQINSPRNARR